MNINEKLINFYEIYINDGLWKRKRLIDVII